MDQKFTLIEKLKVLGRLLLAYGRVINLIQITPKCANRW